MPLLIFSVSLILFLGCAAKIPQVTLNQLDTKHGVANPFKITKYNQESCSLELEAQDPYPIISEKLHGGVCLTAAEYSKMKAFIVSQCRNKQKQ